MDRDVLIHITSGCLKSIRNEYQFTIDKMAELLGISKKSLVHIEEGKNLANWTTTIAVCAIFRDSQTLQKILGRDPLEMIELSTIDVPFYPKEKTLGSNFLWKNIEEHQGFKLQQNLLTHHFRIIDDDNYRLISTFDETHAYEKWHDLIRSVNLAY